MKYHRLTQVERYQIEALKESGLSLRRIALALKRSVSTISREIRRNSLRSCYRGAKAQVKCDERRQSIGPPLRITEELEYEITNLLLNQWSPEQISGRLRKDHVFVSHETIYQHIYRDYQLSGLLYQNLRRKRKWRRTHKVAKNFKNIGKRANQAWIDERPSIVEERKRIGDFERDTVLGKKGAPILLTIVDRTTRLTKLKLIPKLDARATHKATVELLRGYKVQTITNDNGPEFSLHKMTAEALKTKIFFNHPYCSWQRGTNENTNGLIRQYYPKGFDFSLVTKQDIQNLEDRLNSRPRKCLGFKTPLEVHKELSRSVALSA